VGEGRALQIKRTLWGILESNGLKFLLIANGSGKNQDRAINKSIRNSSCLQYLFQQPHNDISYIYKSILFILCLFFASCVVIQ